MLKVTLFWGPTKLGAKSALYTEEEISLKPCQNAEEGGDFCVGGQRSLERHVFDVIISGDFDRKQWEKAWQGKETTEEKTEA